METLEKDERLRSLTQALEKNATVLNNWEALVNHILKRYYHDSRFQMSHEQRFPSELRSTVINLLDTTYESMLEIFPYLENYVIEYANFKLEQNEIGQFHKVYQTYMKAMNNRSLLLWVMYLKIIVKRQDEFKLSTKHILHMFEKAELYIGKHFYSQPFWNLYLIFLKKTYTSNPQIYLSKLRQLIKIPIYDFAYNFKIWFKELASVSDLKQMKFFCDMKKMNRIIPKLLKPREKLQYIKFKVDRVYKKLYKKIEAKVMVLYNSFELPLTIFKQSNQYYTPPTIPLNPSFVQTWIQYINHAMNSKFGKKKVAKDKYYIMLIFQRALLSSSLAHNKIIWSLYIKWLSSIGDKKSAYEMYKQSQKFVINK